jgi:phage anti-repressor protein
MSLDIVNLINNNPITKLSKPYQNKLLNKIKGHFTTDEQQMFVTSFYCYLNYSDDDFVIDFDNVWEWMGFSKKDKAKDVLIKHFLQDTDYKIMLPGTRERFAPIQNGGQNKEIILITLNTFKDMCMRANTKKAKEIRTYFIKLEKILLEVVNEEASELRLQLENKETLLKSTETALQSERKKFADYTKRRYINEPKGERVYALQSNENDPTSEIKIGKSENLRERECNHNTSNGTSIVFHAKACYNSQLLEKVAHHMLAKHRTHKFREWFQISKDTATEVINIAQLVLDEIIPISEHLRQHNVYEKFKTIIDAIKQDPATFECEVQQPEQQEYKSKYDKQNEALAQQNQTISENIKNAVVPELQIKLPLDFKRFIAEQCELDPSYTCLNAELYGSHKLWSGNQSSTIKVALIKYLKENYTSKKIFYQEVNATLATYIGIRPKPLTIPPGHDELTRFVNERCKLGYTFRCNYHTLFDEFTNWKREYSSEYVMDKPTKKKIQDFLNEHLFAAHVYLNVSNLPYMAHNTSTHGVWGITLKTDQSNTGIKLSHKLKKRIVVIDITTNQIVYTFDSLVSAARHFNVNASYISTDIKFGRIRQNYVFRFIKDDGTIIVATKKNRHDCSSESEPDTD